MKTFPWIINQLLVLVQKYEIPGKYWLYRRFLARYGNRLIKHNLYGKNFYVPWDQWCFWLDYGPENYYRKEIDPLIETINRENDRVTLFDLGADIGVVSALLVGNCPNIASLIAVEPNPISFEILNKNINKLKPKKALLNVAISDHQGSADLIFNQQLASDHEAYIQTSASGKTQVTTVDRIASQLDYPISETIVLKVDVEGQEQKMFAGASDTISKASKVILFIELHPTTLSRENLTPEGIFSKAENLRSFKWLVPLKGNMTLDRSKRFYEQVEYQQYDIIGISH